MKNVNTFLALIAGLAFATTACVKVNEVNEMYRALRLSGGRHCTGFQAIRYPSSVQEKWRSLPQGIPKR